MQAPRAADAIGQTPADLARPLVHELPRQRLIDLLADRWLVKLVQIEAPGGFGKSVAIMQAIRDNATDPTGRDVYIRVNPTDADLDALSERICRALGHKLDPELRGNAVQLASEISRKIGTFAPTPITLILDDVHHISGHQDAGKYLQSLLAHLPTNGHLLLAGRELPELALSRLRAADDVTDIDRTALGFTKEETGLLAASHNSRSLPSDADLDQLDGWPALVRLALMAGSAGPANYIAEEVVNQFASTIRHALGAAALAGYVDQAFFDRIGIAIAPNELVEAVPLVDQLGNGDIRPHDLWSEMIDLLLDEATQAVFATAISAWHSDAGRHDEAITVATRYGLWGAAKEALMHALSETDVATSAATTARWTSMFPPDQGDEPELQFLRGWHLRLAHGPGHGDEDVALAMAGFAERGDIMGEARTTFEHGYRGWLAGDPGPTLTALDNAPRLIEGGATFLLDFADSPSIVMADLAGDFRVAREIVLRQSDEQARPELLVMRYAHLSALSFLLGLDDEAIKNAERLVGLESSIGNLVTRDFYRFFAGQIVPVLEHWSERRYPSAGKVGDDFQLAVYSCHIDACLGIEPGLSRVTDTVWGREREQILAACCRLVHAIVTEQPGGETRFVSEVDAVEIDASTLHAELRRFFLLSYVAHPRFRSHIEAADFGEELGPHQIAMRDLGRLLIDIRDGNSRDGSRYRSADETIGAMPLPWTVQLAAGLMANDPDKATELMDRLTTVAGTAAHRSLRSLAEGSTSVAVDATRLLGLVPATPDTPLRITVQGELIVHHGGKAQPVSRSRVRQLLSLLILRRSIERDDAAHLLWSDLDPIKARRNLSTNLTYLRSTLEPERPTSEPPYFVRQHGSRLELQPREHLSIDIWDLVGATEATERRDDLRRVQLEAVLQWTDQLLPDIRDHPELGPEIVAIERKLQDGALVVAERCLADGAFADAARIADRLLADDPFLERAHRCRIASLSGLGHHQQTLAAMGAALDMLDDLDVEPAPETQMLIHQTQLHFR